MPSKSCSTPADLKPLANVENCTSIVDNFLQENQFTTFNIYDQNEDIRKLEILLLSIFNKSSVDSIFGWIMSSILHYLSEKITNKEIKFQICEQPICLNCFKLTNSYQINSCRNCIRKSPKDTHLKPNYHGKARLSQNTVFEKINKKNVIESSKMGGPNFKLAEENFKKLHFGTNTDKFFKFTKK